MKSAASRDNNGASSSATVRGVRDHEIPSDPPRPGPFVGIIAAAWGVWSAIVGLIIVCNIVTSAEASPTKIIAALWLMLTAVCLCLGGTRLAHGQGMRWLVLMGLIAQAVPATLLALR